MKKCITSAIFLVSSFFVNLNANPSCKEHEDSLIIKLSTSSKGVIEIHLDDLKMASIGQKSSKEH